MPTTITFHVSEQDRRNIERIKRRHPTWSEEVICCRALGVYANNLEKPAPPPMDTPPSAQRNIEELFGPPDG
jgi:hypothetical protein